MSRAPVIFVGHGAAIRTGDPADASHRFLKKLGPKLAAIAPRAIIIVSAHHVTHPIHVGSAEDLATIHDHPSKILHRIRYPAHGDADIAKEVVSALANAGIDAIDDPERGLDHGAWLPLWLLFPDAGVPIVPVALDSTFDLAAHAKLGAALAPLRDRGVMILASGALSHDQRAFARSFQAGDAPGSAPASALALDRELGEALESARGDERIERVAAITTTRAGRELHPTPEHLWPLAVALGAAGDDEGRRLLTAFQHGLSTSAFAFGLAA